MLQDIYINEAGLVPNGPYDIAIFSPWISHLRSAGVRILTGSSITQVSDKSVSLNDGRTLSADFTVLCMGQYATMDLVRNSPTLHVPHLEKFVKLSNQVYFSFELCFPRRVDTKYDVFTVKNEPWLPIIERWNAFWTPGHMPNGSVEQWNVAVLDGHSYKGRGISELDPDIIIQYTIEQLQRSDMLRGLTFEGGGSIWETNSYSVAKWPHWHHRAPLVNEQSEYKISFNAGAYACAPLMRTNLPTVLLGSVFTRHRPVVSQEQACLNGRIAAGHILKEISNGNEKLKVIYPASKIPTFPFKIVDDLLYTAGIRPIVYSYYSFVTMNVLMVSLCILTILSCTSWIDYFTLILFDITNRPMLKFLCVWSIWCVGCFRFLRILSRVGKRRSRVGV